MGKAQQKRAQNGPTKHQTLIPLPDPLLLTLGARCSTSLVLQVSVGRLADSSSAISMASSPASHRRQNACRTSHDPNTRPNEH